MTTVQIWTGQEAKALRLALRLSIRDFAAHLGVAPRTIDKWEAKLGGTVPRPEMQAVLDTALRQASEDVRTRFESTLQGIPEEPVSRAVVAVEELVANPADQNGLLSQTVLVQARIEGRDVLVPVSRRLLVEGGMGAVLSALGLTQEVAPVPVEQAAHMAMEALDIAQSAGSLRTLTDVRAVGRQLRAHRQLWPVAQLLDELATGRPS